MFTPTQCSKKITGCFCDSIYVKNTLYTDLIQPKTAGGTVSIPSLVVPPPVIDCLTLSASQTIVGCGADGSGGTGNTAVGVDVLAVATGDNNTAVGNSSGLSLTTGTANTLIGSNSGRSITIGVGNTFIGGGSGFNLTTGNDNVLNGAGAGFNLTTGSQNVMLGTGAGYSATIGIENTLVGNNAGSSTTTASNNTIMGFDSGNNITTGSFNTILGQRSALSLSTGGANTTIGSQAGAGLSTGAFNTVLGYQAGRVMTGTLNGCVLLGNQAGENNTVANRLMIDNSNTDEPLIDGDFVGDTLQINGQVTLGTDSTTPTHKINGLVDGNGNNITDYLVVEINGLGVRRIPLYDSI